MSDKDSNYRHVWFITRPERDPLFHRDALKALQKATDDFSIKWSRNRSVHHKYERQLNESGVKRNSISNDGSGGRTWAAMLKTFSYVYTSDEGYLIPTKVGEKIINGENVHENITKQIMTLQIPNSYFLEPGFKPKFESDFRIRPARFLIKLVNQKSLDYYLRKEEIAFFVMVAKKDNEMNQTIERILEFREADEKKKELMKQEIAERYDHRERSDKGARDYSEAHGDVAHTFMLICDYTGLVDYVRGEALRAKKEIIEVNEKIAMYDERYPFNNRYLISLQRMAENNGLDINSYKATRFRDNLSPATNMIKTQKKIDSILEAYPSIESLNLETLTSILSNEFQEKEASRIALELKNTEVSSLNSSFVENYLYQDDPIVFEDQTGEILKAIGFEVEMRPVIKKHSTKIEIFVHYDKIAGIIDAKKHTPKFNLTAQLRSYMSHEYIPNYYQYALSKGKRLTFYGYISSSKSSGEKQLQRISDDVSAGYPEIGSIKGFIFSSKLLLGFLDYCIDHNLNIKKRIELFMSIINNQSYDSFEKAISATKTYNNKKGS